jgi:hypothetical protein
MPENLELAKEILNQLGGHKFVVMTGARNIFACDNGLQFSFPGCTKTNKCRITLDVMDTYTVEFYKIRGVNCNMIQEYEGVYNDMLQDIFTNTTGLNCTLGTMRG